MTKHRKPGAGAKPKNYSSIEFRKNLTREIAKIGNRELFDSVLNLAQEVSRTRFETVRLEFEIATDEIEKRLSDWLSQPPTFC